LEGGLPIITYMPIWKIRRSSHRHLYADWEQTGLLSCRHEKQKSLVCLIRYNNNNDDR